ncbi:DNA topoisomerase 3-alpha isoform X2 [Cherax quadricarinatus]|uniref:DNA topoisomerase 3-alpha isoform X2 n=1 Tax=Cherax quadricarinatus TaxID=27406 RepID=UPI00237935CA|nr:DNA topoisomerase 3-alpha-like isoform X2 [Cherax quadricarinatus]
MFVNSFFKVTLAFRAGLRRSFTTLSSHCLHLLPQSSIPGSVSKRDGYSVYNKIYEFNLMLNGQQCHMVMTSVSGHLLSHEFTGNYRKWLGCNPLQLFDAPVVKGCIQNMDPIKRTLEKEARAASRLIIWTDCDREGENIGFEISEVCQAVKPSLVVQRAKFSEITFMSVQRALHNLATPDKLQSDAVDVRSELDLRIGAAFTRFQTLRLQKVFPQALAETLISYGSCQFPTLGFVVERYKAIQQFIPEQFWKIKVTHAGEEGVIEFSWRRVRLFDQAVCTVLFEMCEDNPQARVTKVITKNKSKWRPLPLDTVELEKLASRRFHISAKETMKIAEKLYTQGYISYPRTETNIFPKELDLLPLVEMQTQDQNWGGFAAGVLEDGPNPRKGKKSDQAHPPIHPTKYTSDLHGNDQKIYEFIVRRFLACLSKDAKGLETIVDIEIAGEEFTTGGLIILERNYLDVYPYDRWSDKVMPQYEEGQVFDPTSLEIVDGETSPPPLLTEADLIALMEKHGIGTDATHADHIETIKSRMYVGLQDTRFVPGQLGMGLVEGYDSMGFHMSKPNLRAELEADLKRICDGTKDPQLVLHEQIGKYRHVFEEALRQASKIDAALAQFLNEEPQHPSVDNPIPDIPQFTPVCKCSSCGCDVVVKQKRNSGYYLSCQNFPQCRCVLWLPESIIGVTVCEQSCTRCNGSPKKLKLKFQPRSYLPFLPDEYETCLGGCDQHILQTLDITAITFSGQGGEHPVAGRPSAVGGQLVARRPSAVGGQPVAGRPSAVGGQPVAGRPSAGGGQPVAGRPSASGGQSVARRPSASLSNSGYSSTNFSTINNSNQWRIGFGQQRGNSPNINSSRTANTLNNTSNSSNGGQGGAHSNSFIDSSGTSALDSGFTSFGVSQSLSHLPWNGNKSEDQANAIVCNCNEDAIILTVRKEGPNKGRQFYKCPKMQGQGCNFFLWADCGGNTGSRENNDRNNEGGGEGSGSNKGTGRGFNSNNAWDDGVIVCKCTIPAKRLTVQKEGPNKGREFYVCSKDRSEQCHFFKWADELSQSERGDGGLNTWSNDLRFNPVSGHGYEGNTGGTKRKAAEGNKPKKRKCGVCGEEGHNRTTCPQNAY